MSTTTNLRKDLSLYALGGSNWVELRVGKKLPVPKITSTARVVTEQKAVSRREDAPESMWGYRTIVTMRPVKRRITLRNVTWEGGRAIGVLTRRQFREIVGSYPRNGFAAPVPHSFIPVLMGVLNVE